MKRVLNFSASQSLNRLSKRQLTFCKGKLLGFHHTRHYGALRAPPRLAPAPKVPSPLLIRLSHLNFIMKIGCDKIFEKIDKIQICPNVLTFKKLKRMPMWASDSRQVLTRVNTSKGSDSLFFFKTGNRDRSVASVRFSSRLYGKARIKRLPGPLKAIILGSANHDMGFP